jgi:hypothetical protein
MTNRRFRILAIDGGGIKGVFPASFLSTIEEQVGHPIGKYFDLIAGTSTGAIIAIGLSIGMPARDILKFYENDGPSIFSGNRTLTKRISHYFKVKYETQPLRLALENVFGELAISDCSSRLLIPSLNAVNGDIHIFKTRHHPKLVTDSGVKLVDVALAATAAPSYFPPHITNAALPMIDGGIWANNPTGLAVVEAITMVGVPRDNIEVLSLGCTDSLCNFEIPKRGKLAWAARAIEAAMCGQSFGAIGTAKLLIGHDHVHRISPSVSSGRFPLDSASSIQSLKGLGYHEARKALPTLIPLFLSDVVQAFQSFPPNNGRQKCGDKWQCS